MSIFLLELNNNKKTAASSSAIMYVLYAFPCWSGVSFHPDEIFRPMLYVASAERRSETTDEINTYCKFLSGSLHSIERACSEARRQVVDEHGITSAKWNAGQESWPRSCC